MKASAEDSTILIHDTTVFPHHLVIVTPILSRPVISSANQLGEVAVSEVISIFQKEQLGPQLSNSRPSLSRTRGLKTASSNRDLEPTAGKRFCEPRRHDRYRFI